MITETATLTGRYDCFTISQGCCHSLYGGVWASIGTISLFHMDLYAAHAEGDNTL